MAVIALGALTQLHAGNATLVNSPNPSLADGSPFGAMVTGCTNGRRTR